MLIATGSTPKERAICGNEVTTMVESSICMKKETATTKATSRERAEEGGISVLSAVLTIVTACHRCLVYIVRVQRSAK